MSARAAWRLVELGFTHVFRYTPGKRDWIANGLPFEGDEAAIPRAGRFALPDVPTCRPSDAIEQVKAQLKETGWDTCVVVNAERVVLGLLRPGALEAGPPMTAEQVMENGPRTYRPDAALDRVAGYLQRYGLESALITTSEGKLLGLLKREAVEKAVAEIQAAGGA